MFTSLFAKAARRSSTAPVRRAALAAVESLETRRMFAGYQETPLFAPIVGSDSDPGFPLSGLSVAAGEDYFLVGDQLNDSAATDAGQVTLYDGTTGAAIGTYQEPGAQAGAAFGSQVAFIDNDTFAVATTQGNVYVFDAGTPAPIATFSNGDMKFGRRLLGYDNKLIIAGGGFVGMYDPAAPAAAPVVFADPDTLANPDDGGFIGESLAISLNADAGDRLYVGFNRGDTFAGYVAEFNPNAATTPEDMTLEPLHRYQAHVAGDFSFGVSSLAATSTDVFIPSTDNGAVYQFARGAIAQSVTYSEPLGGTYGAKVAISGDTLIVSAPTEAADGDTAGAVYSYEIGNPIDESVLANPNSDQPGPERFGDGVAVLGNGNLVVLDTEYDSTTSVNAGAVYVFAPATDEPTEPTAELDGSGNLVVTGTDEPR